MKINGNAIRPGYLINHQNRLWVAVKTQHTQPGKGGAYLQVELKDVKTGTKLNERFRSSEAVERVRLDEATYQFLYEEKGDYSFMNQETYEQLQLSDETIGEDKIKFLQEGMNVQILLHEGAVIGLNLPDTVILEVVEADPVIKGQTATSSYKPALLANGLRVQVPPHIEAGAKIVLHTEDMSYVERAKEAKN